ncbi:fibrohexamerin-like [Pieris brassicae]|uniref:fibrohexamerin-like n=1 Tax=Pieris brassicae TaxID=7116 RepID=UPI001E65E6F8|nr:fibrohexamerin-like [Pieris brassicae]
MLAILLFLSITACLAGPSDIVRPCKFSNTQCLREIFRLNSGCNPNVQGSIPTKYTIPTFVFHTPYFNSTYIDRNLKIGNNNKCQISEFFYNTKTDVLVIAIDCPFLAFESTRILLQHHSLAEDTSFEYYYKGTYPLVRLTMNIPNAINMNVCTAYTFADVTALPIFQINPNDKKTANFLSRDLTLLNIFERETFYGRARQLMLKYINSYICDFGCK